MENILYEEPGFIDVEEELIQYEEEPGFIDVEEELIQYEEEPIKVYIKINENNEIIAVGSSIFIQDLIGWIEIDSGFGDKYAHAQSQYFDKSLMEDHCDGPSTYCYKYESGQIIEAEV